MEDKNIEKRKQELVQEFAKLCGYDLKKDSNKTNKKEIKEKQEKLVKDYLEGFDEEFETHIKERIKETPILINLFNNYIQQIYKPSKIYKLAIKLKNNIYEEMEKTYTKEQKQLLEQWQYCEDRILDDVTEQAFIYGYAMSCQIRDEAIKQYPIENKTP